MSTLGTLSVILDANAKRFNTVMGSAERKIGSFVGQARTLALGLGAYLGVRALKSLVGGLIGVASEAEEVQSKFNAVFKQTAAAANKWSEEYAQATGFAKTSIKRDMAAMQDTFVPLGYAREDAMELSKAIVGLSGDIASFSNRLPADVMRDMQSAIVGNHETMRKYGVIITEQTLKDTALREGITRNVNAMTSQEKVAARVAVIMAGTADAQGDLERTALSWANQTRRLSGFILDMKGVLGNALLPVMGELIQKANAARPVIESLMNTIAEKLEGITSQTGNLLDTIKKPLMWIIDAGYYLLQMLKAIGAGIKWMVGVALEGVGSLMKELARVNNLLEDTWLGKKMGVKKVKWGEGLSVMGESMVKEAGNDWDKVMDRLADTSKLPSARIEAFFKSVEDGAATAAESIGEIDTAAAEREAAKADLAAYASIANAVDEVNSKLQKQVDLFGKTVEQVTLMRLEAMAENVPARYQEAYNKELERTRELMAQLKGKQELDTMTKNAEALKEKFQAPIEVFRAEVAKLDDMLAAGLIDSDLFSKAYEEAAGRFEKAQGGGEEVIGTFNVSALQNMFGTGRPEERTAVATERSAKATEDLLDEVKTGGKTFGA